MALLSRVWPLNGCAVSLPPGATLHAPPVGPQPARGGALQQEGSKRREMRKLFRCAPHPDPGVKGFLSPDAEVVLDMSAHSCSWRSPRCIWKESPVQMRMCLCFIRCLTQTPGLQAHGYISYHSSPAWLSDVSIRSHLICQVAVTCIHFLSMVSISIIMGETKTPKLNAALATEDDGAFFLQTLHHISW